MEQIISMINNLDAYVWGWPMIVLLLGTHLIMTGATGGIQRKIGTAIKLSVTKDTEAEGEVSQFGALATALASTIGTGNIIGVGTAIYLGGPGAVLWLPPSEPEISSVWERQSHLAVLEQCCGAG